MRRIFSGIQPTGVPHLGNYLGAIRSWARLQDQGQVIYSVVDLHALTVARDPAGLRSAIRGMAAALIACGVDPHQSVLFQQSQVPEHAELAWILSCHTPLGWLRRMTQFKAKAGKVDRQMNVENDESVFQSTVQTGLFTYPTLMAADILLYRTTHVPVGEDQVQHVELTRMLARSINSHYKQELFTVPETIIGEVKRVMSLRDGTTKMSKSDESDMSRINLDDTPEQIAQKIKRAKTDSEAGLTFDPTLRPELANLLGIYAALCDLEPASVVQHLGVGMSSGQFKAHLIEVLVTKLAPIRSELARLQQDPVYVERVLTDGAERARSIAQPHLGAVKRALGLA